MSSMTRTPLRTRFLRRRAAWKGWTLVSANGRLITDADFQEPFLRIKKRDAEETCEREIGDRVVRCEIHIARRLKEKPKMKATQSPYDMNGLKEFPGD